jgi:hypothetical protein
VNLPTSVNPKRRWSATEAGDVEGHTGRARVVVVDLVHLIRVARFGSAQDDRYAIHARQHPSDDDARGSALMKSAVFVLEAWTTLSGVASG